MKDDREGWGMKTLQRWLVIGMCAVLAACSASDLALAFAGKYLFSDLQLTTNSCHANAALTLANGTDIVNQEGRSVSIISDGTVISGSVDSDNGGFSISMSQIIDGITVKVTFAFRIRGSDNNYDLKITTTTGECVIEYSGTASKV